MQRRWITSADDGGVITVGLNGHSRITAAALMARDLIQQLDDLPNGNARYRLTAYGEEMRRRVSARAMRDG